MKNAVLFSFIILSAAIPGWAASHTGDFVEQSAVPDQRLAWSQDDASANPAGGATTATFASYAEIKLPDSDSVQASEPLAGYLLFALSGIGALLLTCRHRPGSSLKTDLSDTMRTQVFMPRRLFGILRHHNAHNR